MRALLVAVGLGIAVGAAARAGHEVPGAYWAASLGGPWLVAAFAAGSLATRLRLAALAGAAVIVAGTLAYYSVLALQPAHGARYGVAMALAWSTAGLAIGGAFGLAGLVWRRGGGSPRRAAGVAMLAGALVGEALLLLSAWDSPWGQRVLAAELAAGVLVALALAPGRRSIAVAMTAASAGVFVVAASVVRDTLRAAGWAGA